MHFIAILCNLFSCLYALRFLIFFLYTSFFLHFKFSSHSFPHLYLSIDLFFASIQDTFYDTLKFFVFLSVLSKVVHLSNYFIPQFNILDFFLYFWNSLSTVNACFLSCYIKLFLHFIFLSCEVQCCFQHCLLQNFPISLHLHFYFNFF